MSPLHKAALAGLLALVTAVPSCSGAASPAPLAGAASPASVASVPPDPAPPVSGWAAVLSRLDGRRARAYERGEPQLLRRVYVAGSAVLRHDRGMLQAYDERDVRLSGVRIDLLAVHLVDRSRRLVRLRVVDRLDRPTAHTAAGRILLPQDLPTRRVVVLHRARDGWRIAAVRRLAG